MPSLNPKRTLRESGSIALVLLLWGVVALLIGTDSTLETGIHVAGLIMAGLYALLRGRVLAPDVDGVYETTDPGAVLRDNARALLPALAWFGAALLVDLLESFVFQFAGRLFGLGYPRDMFVFVFVGTGVMTVLLYAVATGYTSASRLGSRRSFADD